MEDTQPPDPISDAERAEAHEQIMNLYAVAQRTTERQQEASNLARSQQLAHRHVNCDQQHYSLTLAQKADRKRVRLLAQQRARQWVQQRQQDRLLEQQQARKQMFVQRQARFQRAIKELPNLPNKTRGIFKLLFREYQMRSSGSFKGCHILSFFRRCQEKFLTRSEFQFENIIQKLTSIQILERTADDFVKIAFNNEEIERIIKKMDSVPFTAAPEKTTRAPISENLSSAPSLQAAMLANNLNADVDSCEATDDYSWLGNAWATRVRRKKIGEQVESSRKLWHELFQRRQVTQTQYYQKAMKAAEARQFVEKARQFRTKGVSAEEAQKNFNFKSREAMVAHEQNSKVMTALHQAEQQVRKYEAERTHFELSLFHYNERSAFINIRDAILQKQKEQEERDEKAAKERQEILAQLKQLQEKDGRKTSRKKRKECDDHPRDTPEKRSRTTSASGEKRC